MKAERGCTTPGRRTEQLQPATPHVPTKIDLSRSSTAPESPEETAGNPGESRSSRSRSGSPQEDAEEKKVKRVKRKHKSRNRSRSPQEEADEKPERPRRKRKSPAAQTEAEDSQPEEKPKRLRGPNKNMTKKEKEKRGTRYPVPSNLRSTNTKEGGRLTHAYRCPYCVEKSFGEYHLVYKHISYDHEEALSMELGDDKAKWDAAYNRVENLTRRSLRHSDPPRILQHFTFFKKLFKEQDRDDLYIYLERCIGYAFAETGVKLEDETFLPTKSGPAISEMLSRLEKAPAYKNTKSDGQYFPMRPAR